jgi:quinol monooxygenase YgiN
MREVNLMTDAGPGALGTTTVRLIPVFEAKPGFENELAGLLRDLEAVSRRDPGCLEYRVFGDGDSPGTFMLYEEWTSMAALDAHNELQHVKDFFAAADPVMAGKLRVFRPGTP